MSQKAISIRVPGSTSNLGAGFDSLGLAVGRYLQIDVEESEGWQFECDSPYLDGLSMDQDNLMVHVASETARTAGKTLPPCRVKVKSELPLARGLGSSAAAIIAGIEWADSLLNLHLTTDEKFSLALEHERHGDNLGASLCGGLVVTSLGAEGGYPSLMAAGVPDIEMVVMVPPEELKTTEARRILPDVLPFQEAVRGSSVANMMVAAILQNNWERAGRMMAEDVFHQPYRLGLVPELKAGIEEACKAGAYGAALSGAGPSVIAFVAHGKGHSVAARLTQRFPENDMLVVAPDACGAQTQSQTKTPSTL